MLFRFDKILGIIFSVAIERAFRRTEACLV